MPHYEYDKDYPFAAFITNLGKYNEGSLVGEWVKFPTTAEEMQKVFERIGIGSKDDFGQPYEEWFITDYDCYVDGLYDKLGEYENLDELNYLASKLDEMSQGEYEQFQAAMEIGDHSSDLQEIINLTENLDCYDIYPDIHDHDDLGRYYIEELDAMQVPEYLRNYIDYEAYGRDVALEEGGEFTDFGYVRDTGDTFHEYYDGEHGSIPEEYVPKAQRELLISEHYTRMVISTSVGVDGEIPFAVATQLRETAQEYYPDAYLIAGEAVNTLDMRDTVTEDDIVVNGIAVGAIFLILLITFKSLSLPAILVFVIESAIWMNLAVPYLTGERLNYIAYLIINTVQLGATVDYAILFTNKYLENRRENSRWHAARITVRETVVSILTSGSILCIAGSMLGALSTNGVISQLGYLVGRGAVLSCCMVLFVLPTCLCLFDGLVQKTSLGLRFEKNY